MIESRKINIEKLMLKDFLELELNKALYKDFKKIFKSYFKFEVTSFYRYIYSDVVYFLSKYNKTPDEVSDYFSQKYSKEGNDISFLIMREITFQIVRIATTSFIWSKGVGEYVAFEPDSFIDGRNFPFLIGHHFNHNNHIEGYYHIRDFVNARCEYPKDQSLFYDYDKVNHLKNFITSIDISEATAFPSNERIKKANQDNISKSLKWYNNDFTELNAIHPVLKEHGYINCDLRTFKKLFENTEEYSPVEWNRTATSLIYFYGRLFERKKIKSSRKKWKTLPNIFTCESLSSAAQIYSSIKNENKNLPEKSFFDSLIN